MIVITGATGLVGRNLIPEVKKYFKNEKIVCLVWNKNTPLENFGRKILEKHKIKTLEVDLTKKSTLKKIPQQPNFVIHIAANTDTENPDHKVNDLGTKNLYYALNITPKTHFIHISTIALCGGRINCSEPLDEQSPYHATNEYSRTKMEAEKFLIEKCEQQKFKLTILRLNTVYGKNPRPNSLFENMTREIKKGSFVTRLNWPGYTSLVHVKDVVLAILQLSKLNFHRGIPQLYVIYSESMTLAQISALMHKKLKIKFKPINMPKIFWLMCRLFRPLVPLTEKLLPLKIYNPIWRATLIVDNAVYCKSKKIFSTLPKFGKRKLTKHITEVFTEPIGSYL